MSQARVGVIGGSGFYEMEGLTEIEQLAIETPYGPTSDPFTVGTLEGERVAFLPRHGAGHRFSPTELPVKAAIWAFKQIGVEYIISISAVGSLREELAPLHVMVPGQLIDRTRLRDNTFFGGGVVAHIGFADPFCPNLSQTIYEAASATSATVHQAGTLVVMEGPAFSTRAESNLYRSWGADIIGMTALPEAKLAREAEICYAAACMITDYDVWHDAEEDVTVDLVIANLLKNVEVGKQIVRNAVRALPPRSGCPCPDALASAIITNAAAVPEAKKQELAPIIGRYFPVGGSK